MAINLVKQERNRLFSSLIIDYFGVNWFKNKKILELGVGDGEVLNSLSRLGVEKVVAVDARPKTLEYINKTFPHITTLLCDLEHSFPFDPNITQFDLVISIDLLCHIKNWYKHINDLMSIGSNIVLESEILDHSSNSVCLPIKENTSVPEFSFSGEGSIVSGNTVQSLISKLGGKFKRINESKLNSYNPNYRYDWVETGNLGRNSAFRRFWFIRRDPFLFKAQNAAKNTKEILKEEIESHTIILEDLPVLTPEEIKNKQYFLHQPSLTNYPPNLIKLFTIYQSNNPNFEYCLHKNLDNINFNTILIEEKNNLTFNDVFKKINKLSLENDINIISRLPIYFDDTIKLINNIKHKELYALTPWNAENPDSVSFRDKSDSQDVWIFRGKIEDVNGDFPIMRLGSDNRIAYEFQKAGYRVYNPCKSIRSYFYGHPEIRSYPSVESVPGPHLFIIGSEFKKSISPQ